MSKEATERIYRHFLTGFDDATRGATERRVGAELKFPFVDAEGRAVAHATVDALWAHLVDRGWAPDIDSASGRTVGTRKPGDRNATVASCETGYCKTEFSLAHAADLHELDRTRASVVADLRPFLEANDVYLLCYGTQPVTAPSSALLMQKMRASFWDKALPSNNVIPAAKGDDVHLFTCNACSHVHVSVAPDEAVRAVNVLNGLAGAQIALTANSNVTTGWDAPPFKSINEKLWDWWEPVKGRVGVPEAPFEDMHDYVARICALPPIYVKRDGHPVLLTGHYDHFSDYFAQDEAIGRTVEGAAQTVVPAIEDVAVHNSCYWYTARISRYFTVENRVFDEQPRDALLAPAALTLGLLAALPEAWEEVAGHDWAALRETRETACRHGMDRPAGGVPAADLAGRMLDIAALGLQRRGRDESAFLAPLRERHRRGRCPADAIIAIKDDHWPTQLLERYAL